MIYDIKNLSDLEAFIKEHPSNLRKYMNEKRAVFKEADAVIFSAVPNDLEITHANKELGVIKAMPQLNENEIFVKAIINTTNVLDSHMDVHIPGLWKKSLRENKYILHLQEHTRKHTHVISDNVNAYTSNISWSHFGLPYEGKTQALIFGSVVDSNRNAYMYDQYKKGFVRQHSVGMQYVKLLMCVDSEESWAKEYKDNWDKYIDQIVNKSDAEELGLFWAVLEAKVIEGSSVVFASNTFTPTESVTTPKEANQETKEDAVNNDTSNIDTNEPTQEVTPLGPATESEEKSKIDYSEVAKAILKLKTN